MGDDVARVPSVKPIIAMAAMHTCIQENTGLAIETLRMTLLESEQLICSHSPSGLGQLLVMKAMDTIQHVTTSGLHGVRACCKECQLTKHEFCL